MKVLGITSAIGVTGASVADGTSILSECSISSKAAPSEKLITLIKDTLERTKVGINDIDAVSVTIGPGSYSGLRGGLATAKGLVEALDIPIIPVSTLHAIAFNFVDHDGTVAIAVNACRDDYNFALFGSDRGSLKRLTGDITLKVQRIAEVFSEVEGDIIIAADGPLMSMIKRNNIRFAEARNVIPWASNVALIGLEKLKKKEFGDYLKMAPEYSHQPNIREYRK